MKVAVLSFYQGRVTRGVETFVHELNSKLKNQVDLTVYQAGLMPPASKAVRPNLLTLFYLDQHSLAIKVFSRRILIRLALSPPDILMPLNNGWMSLLAKRFCQRYPTKLVLPGFAGISWEDRLNLFLNPDAFVACTKHQADWARTINPRAKIVTINIGVNTDRFKSEGGKYAHGLTPPVVLCIAGPEDYKRVDLAIKAVARLKHTSLLVVGQQTKSIIELGEKLLGSGFKNIQVDYQRLDQIYRSVDAFTLPSKACEAYGISILEALATNLPVVVNDDPIRQELVGKAGILVKPEDLSAYAQALQTALSVPLDNHPRRQALKFSWEIISKQYRQLWSELIS